MARGAFGRSDAEIDLLVRGMRSGIAVVGFGYIGTVIGAVLADRGWPVTGIDVQTEASSTTSTRAGPMCLSRGSASSSPTAWESAAFAPRPISSVIADNDFIIVTVGTPLGPDYEPIVDDIKAAARAVGEHLHAGPPRHPQEHGAARHHRNSRSADPRRGLRAAGRGRLRVGVLPRAARRRPSHPRADVDPRRGRCRR